MTAIQLDVSGIPIPQGSKRAFKRGSKLVVVDVKPKELKAWRDKIAAACPPNRLNTGAVIVSMVFSFTRPKTVKREHMTVPPDLDKLIRAVLDALTGCAYIDDKQVVEIVARKKYTSKPVGGVKIQVMPVS